MTENSKCGDPESRPILRTPRKTRRILGTFALLCLGVSCSNASSEGQESVVSSQAAVTPTSTRAVAAWSMTVTLPTWGTLGPLAQAITGQQSVAIGANSGAGIVIESASTNKRRAVIAAGGPVTVQPDAKVVDIIATGKVDLRDRVKVVGNLIAPVVTLGNNVAISGQTVKSTPVAGDALIWIASTPARTVSSWDLQPGQSQTITPGRYGDIAIKSTAKLILSTPGRYFLESLDLEPGGTLQLPSADQGTEIYVHGKQLILRGKVSGPTNVEERVAIIYAGTSDVFVEAQLVGALMAPSANVTLRAVTPPHTGAGWGQTVNLDAGAKLQPVAQPFLVTLGGLSKTKCSWAIPPKSTGAGRKDEFQFQYEILKYCFNTGASDNELRLRAQNTYEGGESAAAVSNCTIQPSQYLGFTRRRAEQLRAIAADSALAARIVAGPDADGDWVPDSSDTCAGTPLWTPVDDKGCAMPLPPGPDCAAVQSAMGKMGMLINPACDERAANMPNIEFAVAIYYPGNPSEGVYLYVQDLPAQPAGCESWYEFEIVTRKARKVLHQFNVAFPYSSVSHTGRVVSQIPQPYVQLQASPTAEGSVGRLGQAAQDLVSGTIDEVVFRVRSVSGLGTKSAWGTWQTPVPEDCRSVGFSCQ